MDAEKKDAFIAYGLNRHADRIPDRSFPNNLYLGVIKKQSTIDEIIVKAAPSWPVDKIALVDRNVLRLGIYELLFSERSDVPPRVAINESIELAKTFGGPNSYKFVSGVLGSIYEASDLKKEDAKLKKKQDAAREKDLPVSEKAGAVVYSIDDQGVMRMAFVHDIFGKWTLSKGGYTDGEKPEDAVVREIKKEINLDVVVKTSIGSNEYVAHDPESGKIKKRVHYFLVESPFVEMELKKDNGGLIEARWFELEEITTMETYPDVKPFVKKSLEFLEKESSKEN